MDAEVCAEPTRALVRLLVTIAPRWSPHLGRATNLLPALGLFVTTRSTAASEHAWSSPLWMIVTTLRALREIGEQVRDRVRTVVDSGRCGGLHLSHP